MRTIVWKGGIRVQTTEVKEISCYFGPLDEIEEYLNFSYSLVL